ncbi:unnamed protein product [Paramecium sonneborni]|uniref:Uncharacterized protein n=1 Tax=Paramecium sonneborni TaxID=65129 RepID=A0A8S1PJJ9_9CILI|nr:unnamed protein product [Paramecium sonneborni]
MMKLDLIHVLITHTNLYLIKINLKLNIFSNQLIKSILKAKIYYQNLNLVILILKYSILNYKIINLSKKKNNLQNYKLYHYYYKIKNFYNLKNLGINILKLKQYQKQTKLLEEIYFIFQLINLKLQIEIIDLVSRALVTNTIIFLYCELAVHILLLIN